MITNSATTRTITLGHVAEHPDNYNRHSDEQLDNLAASLVQFGYVRRIVVQEAGDGRFVCVAGHGVLSVLKKSGVQSAEATILPPEWTDDRILAYLVADNELARQAQADNPALERLLQRVRSNDAALLPATGFNEDRFRSLLIANRKAEIEAIRAEAAEDEDAELEQTPAEQLAQVWGTQAGQIWALGRHRLAVGDNRDPATLDALVAGAMMDGCWGDPPYGVEYSTPAGSIANDKADGLLDLLVESWRNVDRLLKPGAPIYMAAPAGDQALDFLLAWKAVGWRLHQILTWVKDALVLGHSDYNYQHELIMYGWKPGDRRPWQTGRSESTVLNYPRPRHNATHPTAKPMGLVRQTLANSLPVGSVVLEPFAGSGTTLVVCEGLGMSCYAIDVDPGYAAVALARWSRLTGQRPELV